MEEKAKKDNLIVQLTFKFAIDCVSFCNFLEEQRKWSLANQLLRAALSVGANVSEAQNAESKADFVHKLKIAAKEAEEVSFYLEVCQETKELPNPGVLLTQIESILKVLNKIIGTSKKVVA